MTFEPTDDEKTLIEKLRRDGARKRASALAGPELAKRYTGFAPGLDKDLNPFPVHRPKPSANSEDGQS
ncbi:hypothetical protein [Saccharopolyspora sp. NPDC050642]|uniref:hypothetical protein n=1 Tax=Saccharopolyspora sp. NPDC050642 TaxID=3157099 RepID=UPI0033DC421C